MAVKIGMHKTSAEGEMLTIEVDMDRNHYDALKHGVRLRDQLEPYFQLLDDRLLEMNNRIIASNYMVKKLPVEAQMAIHNVIDVLYGRTAGPPADAILKEAHEEVERAKERARILAEENAALQAAVEEAEEQQEQEAVLESGTLRPDDSEDK